MTNEPKVRDNYNRSPYAQRLEKSHFLHVVWESGDRYEFTSGCRSSFKPYELEALLSVCRALKGVGKRRRTSKTLYCFFTTVNLQGVMVREWSGNCWFRQDFWSPESDDSSLSFIDVSDDITRKLLPPPEHG